jgi:hypothetical protein
MVSFVTRRGSFSATEPDTNTQFCNYHPLIHDEAWSCRVNDFESHKLKQMHWTLKLVGGWIPENRL